VVSEFTKDISFLISSSGGSIISGLFSSASGGFLSEEISVFFNFFSGLSSISEVNFDNLMMVGDLRVKVVSSCGKSFFLDGEVI